MPENNFQFIKLINEIAALPEGYEDEDKINALYYIITLAKDEGVKFHAINEINRIRILSSLRQLSSLT